MKLSMPVFLLAATASTSASESSCKEDVTSIEHHENLVANYLKIWNGEDFSLVDETFSPDVFVHFDRLPSGEGKDGDGSVPLEFHDRDAFLEFVKSSRTGWDEYTFQVYFSAAQGLHGAFRWGLKAVVGADFDLVETPLEQGDAIYSNGTDFTVLNECTGLIDEAYVAQDLIQFFHALKVGSISV